MSSLIGLLNESRKKTKIGTHLKQCYKIDRFSWRFKIKMRTSCCPTKHTLNFTWQKDTQHWELWDESEKKNRNRLAIWKRHRSHSLVVVVVVVVVDVNGDSFNTHKMRLVRTHARTQHKIRNKILLAPDNWLAYKTIKEKKTSPVEIKKCYEKKLTNGNVKKMKSNKWTASAASSNQKMQFNGLRPIRVSN